MSIFGRVYNFLFPEFAECDQSECQYNYLINKSGQTIKDLNPPYRYDQETGDCRECKKGIADFKRDFPRSADRTAYIANTILPQILQIMGSETAIQEKEVKVRVGYIFNCDDFIARLQIVLRGISDWDEKIELLAALHPCHTPPSDLEIINFPNIPRYTRQKVIQIGADYLPREFYINDASFKLRNPNNQTRRYLLETPKELQTRRERGYAQQDSGTGIGTFS